MYDNGINANFQNANKIPDAEGWWPFDRTSHVSGPPNLTARALLRIQMNASGAHGQWRDTA